MNILVPRLPPETDWRELIRTTAARATIEPFDDLLVDFVEAVSKAIGAEPQARSAPDLVALAHWMRRAHVLEMKREFDRSRGDAVVAARGMVAHFAPANVDALFVYSWFVSLLAGNCNIVRVSGGRREQSAFLERVLGEVLLRPRFERVRERNLVLTYPHDDEITAFVSHHCQVRVLWGGDDAVRGIRSIPLAPLALELPFPDRFSMAALNAAAVTDASEDELRKLAHRFCNDAFTFDQLACSSPRAVFWIGPPALVERAQGRFWPAVRSKARERNLAYPDVVGIDRATAMFAYAAEGQVSARSTAMTEFPGRVSLSPDARGFRSMHCGGGLFLEASLPSLLDALPYVDAKDQTLTHFGFTEPELRAFAARLPPRAIDRIVPVGQALEFSYVWDGVDLFHFFTRIIDVRG